ncbi:MAG: DNA repair and recombination protein RadA [Candidatus Heimdallarchaeota archaeon LC_2]|nr:MAG: DNA repair and recombination protein RadA [Candidatus Heimdallarchaeota archaeon LC_2]
MVTQAEDRPTFELEGITYLAEPTMDEFLVEAGFKTPSAQKRAKSALTNAGFEDYSGILALSAKEIEDIEGISAANAKVIFNHALKVKLKGNLVINYEGMVKREEDFNYLPTGSSSLDEMLTYSGGQVGWRSKTMVEFYGEPAMGKTQICYTAAAMVMASKERGGWERGVAYIDTEGAFVLDRFKYLARYWGADMEKMKDKFLYSRADSMDEVELALDEITKVAKEKDIGIVVIDSIMDALKSQYPVGGSDLAKLQPRQKHLKRVLDKLKNMAVLFNMVVFYTNHVRSNIGGQMGTPELGAQGGAVMGHASDIRMVLHKATKAQRKDFGFDDKPAGHVGLKVGRATIVDCGFLPEGKGFYLIGPMGIADPNSYDQIFKQATEYKEKGYISLDGMGNELVHLDPSAKKPKTYIEENQSKIYGAKKEEKKKEEKKSTKTTTKKVSNE